MLPIKGNYLNDIDSLLEYERLWGRYVSVSMVDIVRRMTAVERLKNTSIPDTYLDGLTQYNVGDKYETFPQIMYGMPMEMAKEYLTCQDGRLYVKGNMFEDWMEHIIRIPPSLFIAGYWLNDFSLSMIRVPSELHAFVRKRLSMFAYTTMLHPFLPELKHWVSQTDGLYDLHVHLNGTTETDAVWIYMLHHQDVTVRNFSMAYNKQISLRKLSEQILTGFTPQKLQSFLVHAQQLRQDMLTMVASQEYRSTATCTKIDYLWKDFSAKSSFEPLIGEILLLLIVFAELRKTQNIVLAQKMHHYLLIKGVIHRFCVQQKTQVGFSQFQMMTGTSFRDEIEKTYEQRFLQLAGSDNRVHLGLVEGRFSPKDTALKNYRLLRDIELGFNKALAILGHKSDVKCPSHIKLALVAHFIKRPETKSTKKIENRHHFLRVDLQKKAIALYKVLQTSLGRKLIVGIDAAANELDAGPEVFAPMFHYLKKRGVNHITYHAGEDFRHLLGGIRAVVEAVSFLKMKAGDRIGHGTALGIDPFLWKERVKGVCFVQQGEWLYDLVFVWNLIRTNKRASCLAMVLPRIESVIAELSVKVYGKIVHPSVLYKTCLLRAIDPECLFGIKTRQEALSIYNYDEIEEYEKIMADKEISLLMRKYHAASEGSALSIFRNAYDDLIEVVIGNLLTCEQLRIIQNIVLEELSQGGVVIEALPTSNLRISYYQKIDEYHVNRWTDTEHTDCALPAIVIGSDDPGIFMTNIYNEYARVYSYLTKKSMSSVERLDIMKKIRESSVIYNFVCND